ncbi:hypothetical protein [Neisseria macacae]|uniref:hypothetical protein n=1 Tax=Neisseria macacae TaxID=496 RepID=UPI0012DD9181|nr:hypothetical protein [Neisseria macacae]
MNPKTHPRSSEKPVTEFFRRPLFFPPTGIQSRAQFPLWIQYDSGTRFKVV